jgi:hypothetical protein
MTLQTLMIGQQQLHQENLNAQAHIGLSAPVIPAFYIASPQLHMCSCNGSQVCRYHVSSTTKWAFMNSMKHHMCTGVHTLCNYCNHCSLTSSVTTMTTCDYLHEVVDCNDIHLCYVLLNSLHYFAYFTLHCCGCCENKHHAYN